MGGLQQVQRGAIRDAGTYRGPPGAGRGPEVFEALLKDDEFEFTLKNLEIFQVAMVNLDQSIKRELALIRGTSRLEDSGWMRNIAPLPITTLLKMTTDDICKEVSSYLKSHLYCQKYQFSYLPIFIFTLPFSTGF